MAANKHYHKVMMHRSDEASHVWYIMYGVHTFKYIQAKGKASGSVCKLSGKYWTIVLPRCDKLECAADFIESRFHPGTDVYPKNDRRKA